MGRRSGPAVVIQSFKKVINIAPASVAAGTSVVAISLGTDSVAAGQTSPTDNAVPTGSVIKYFEIQHALANLAAVGAHIHTAIELLHSGQSLIGPDVVGGNPKRNQVFNQRLYQIGENQSDSKVFRFKIPKKFQRVREGDAWQFIWKNSNTVSAATQVIYKFYR